MQKYQDEREKANIFLISLFHNPNKINRLFRATPDLAQQTLFPDNRVTNSETELKWINYHRGRQRDILAHWNYTQTTN